MRQFYLVSSIVVGVLILIMAFAQLGASCTWYLFPSNAPAFLILLQTAALGAVVGGLLVLWWKSNKDEEGSGGPQE